MFIKESDATVLFPGGFGTLDEAYEGLTLIQTGKSLPRPILLMQNKGDDYWQIWVSFFNDVMLRDKYISPDDLDLFRICESNQEAIDIISEFYSTYHSLRYVRDNAVIRLNKEISEQLKIQFQTTLVIYRNNNEIYRSLGVLSKDKIYTAIKSVINS